MATTRTLPKTQLEPSDDPFIYGYRWMGNERYDEEQPLYVPLTIEDVLYPQEGDTVSASDFHFQLLSYIHTLLSNYFHTDRSLKALCNVRVHFEIAGIDQLAPDIIVLGGVTEYHHQVNWTTFPIRTGGHIPCW